MKKRYIYGTFFLFLPAIFLTLLHSTGNLQQQESPGAVFTVTNNLDMGAGSFRQAVIDANASAGTDTIQFAVGTGPVEINNATALPDITQPVIIDGTTQPGFSGTPLIRLTGSSGGLKITGGGSTVRAIAVVNTNLGITLENGGGNIIAGSYIGICPQAVVFPCGNNVNGILINNSPNNQIGGSTAAERNNIGVNVTNGILITGSASSGNIITGNLIGLLADGTIRRNRETGVRIDGAPNNRIGGTTAGERNVISTNGLQLASNPTESGVLITGAGSTGNVVQGNYIGTMFDGTDFGLGAQNTWNGVRIEGAANNTIGGTVGTTPGGACTGACNLIATFLGNGNRSGVTITGSGATGNSVLGNHIGTNVAGTAALNNNISVMVTAGASNNTVGGTTAAGRNLINNGIRLTAGAATNTVQGNYIGTDTSGNTGISFMASGVAAVTIDNSSNNQIGTPTGTTLGGACTGGCNLISGNDFGGLRITGAASTGNRVDYNYVGLNAAGTTALRNGVSAISLQNGANNNTIGRPLPATPFQTEACADNAPQAIRCIQDDVTGDWIRFNDVTGEYMWMNCRSGVMGSGVGEISSVVGLLVLQAVGVDVTINPKPGGGGAAGAQIVPPPDSLLNTFYIRDRNILDNTCVCPTEGETVITGPFTIDGANGTLVNGILMGSSSNGLINWANPGENIRIGQNASFIRLGANDITTNDVPAVEVDNGVGNELEIFFGTWLRFGQVSGSQGQANPGLVIDLNANGSRDQNDPGDVDAGANNTQNYPVFSLKREANGGIRTLGSFPCEQGTTLRISLHGVNAFVRNGQTLETARSLGIKFNVTESSGQCNINQLFTGVDAFAIRNQERISATATKVPPTPLANPTDSLVGVNGDTSEFMPPVVVPQPTFDFDNDGRTDISVWRPSDGNWHISQSTAGYALYTWGASGDHIVPGDYDGDDKADVAVWRPSNGGWYILNSFSGTYSTYTWGTATDIPVLGDYDDDQRTDVAVYRPSTGTWYILNSLGGNQTITWGSGSDVPVAGDFDGDGQTDIAVWRPSTGQWFINRSSAGSVTITWGVSTDRIVHADYDGDGKDDVAVWRPSTGDWFILNSSNGSYSIYTWGAAGDVPVPGDYDGDGKADISVVRNGVWHILQSTSGYRTATWGVGTDIAIPGRY